GYSVHGQLFDTAGVPSGSEFQVNTYTTGYQGAPAVAESGFGHYLVVWSSNGGSGTDGSGTSIQAQQFDVGTAVGTQCEVNSYTTGFQGLPAGATNRDGIGNFVVSWTSLGGVAGDTDGSYSVEGRRFGFGNELRGKRILMKDPTGAEPGRTVVAL